MANAKESLPKLLEVAAAGNTEVVRAKRKTMKALNLHDSIEDMLITLGNAYHMIRPLAADRASSNLAIVRNSARSSIARCT
jgi:hypothetical protein